jgi:prepilin-type N-terminal cleavage/methylation domain-containing protein
LKPSKNKLTALHDENGFNIIELAMVLIILAILLSAGALSYVAITRSTRLNGAMSQIEAALNRAKLSARQENVTYEVVFYPSNNTYEFFHNVGVADPGDPMALAWSMTPVDNSVSAEAVTEAGGHWLIKVQGGVLIASPQTTVIFSPTGTAMSTSWEPAGGGSVTIDLNNGKAGSVSVDAEGNISTH